MKLIAIALLLFPVFAVAQQQQNCGVINGTTFCQSSTNCGYVNGIYQCAGESKFFSSPKVTDSKKLAKQAPYDAGIKDGVQWMAGWFSSWDEGEQGVLGRFGRWLVQKFVTAWIEAKLAFLNFGWGVAKGILNDMGVFTALQNAWSGLSSDALSVLNFFGIPAAINILLNAGVTRFVLRFLPSF